jgi:hypothetical protein
MAKHPLEQFRPYRKFRLCIRGLVTLAAVQYLEQNKDGVQKEVAEKIRKDIGVEIPPEYVDRIFGFTVASLASIAESNLEAFITDKPKEKNRAEGISGEGAEGNP